MSEPLQSRTERRRIWLFAAITAVVLHAGLGAFAGAHREEPEEVDLGAPGIEIGIEPASPRVATSELPAGPDSEASIATPPSVQRESKVAESRLPLEEPLPAEAPDRPVTKTRSDEPIEEVPDTPAQPSPPSEASIAQEATAVPSTETEQEASKSITLDPGTGRNRQRVRATWQRELIAHLDKHKRYPSERSHMSADLLVTLVLDRSGKVVSATVAKSSGDPAFDAAALAMVRRSDPVPAPPALIADDGLTFALPVNFRLRRNR